MVEQGLYQLIESDGDIDALVNGVYWILAPKGAVVPYIVLSRVATTDVYTMNGATGTRSALFQVDCYATDFYTSRSIALAVRELLESYRGNLPDVNATAVAAVLTAKDWDMPYEEGSGKGFVYRALLQFRVWYYDTAVSVAPAPDLTTVIEGGKF
jgi:hypothetical protein